MGTDAARYAAHASSRQARQGRVRLGQIICILHALL
jgi:hypothetical protein